MKNSKNVFTTFEAADYCGVHNSTIRNWIKKGILKSYKTPGGHRRIKKNDMDDFLTTSGMRGGTSSADTSKKILIVDDDVDLLKTIAKFLEEINENFKLATAENGFDAGKLVYSFRPHLVVLDLMMPGLDGFQVCSNLKNDPDTSDIKVLAITGFYSSANIEKIKKCGADHCLPKPVDMFEFISWIYKMMGLTVNQPLKKLSGIN